MQKTFEFDIIYFVDYFRYIRDMENPFEFYSEIQFKKRFRFRKEVVRDILLPMVHVREPMTNRGLPVPTLIGLLFVAFLR